MMRPLLLWISCLLITTPVSAASKLEIQENNTPAIVYLEIKDNESGSLVESGSGFIVSHDGYIITAAHLKTSPNQTMFATEGERYGTQFPLTRRDVDEENDVALWQFPQSHKCRYSVKLTRNPVEINQNALALGFPGRNQGLTPINISITNLQSERGFYKVDGYLEAGNSGGPVFDEDGSVIGFVQGGKLPGTENNDVVPIALAINLINKRNIPAAIDTEIPFNASCYASCRHKDHGIEKWQNEQKWKDNTSWLDGGSGQETECNKIAAGIQSKYPASEVEVTSTDESSQKDVFGHVTYKYFCEGKIRRNPIYIAKRSEACGLWK